MVILLLGCLEGMAASFSGAYWGAVNPNWGPLNQRIEGAWLPAESTRLVAMDPDKGGMRSCTQF